MSEKNHLVWFHNRKVPPHGVIMDEVILPNIAEREDVGNVALAKIHHPIAF